jgi:L-asparaginase II
MTIIGPIRVAATRGGRVEALHRVHGVVVRDGVVVEAVGDPDLVTFWRSGAKPVQALPLLREFDDLAVEEVAIACSSHEARAEQLAAVRLLLMRAGVGEDDLECGSAEFKLRHNCSGKHAGMLAVCGRRGWSLPGYRVPGHPMQREILGLVSEVTSVPSGDIDLATDGCGVVTFALPLRAMAAGFERLAADEVEGAGEALAAMRARPDLVGGPASSDTRLMRGLEGAVAKRGAEGLLCGALPDGSGFALKAEDGSERPLDVAAAALLGIDALSVEAIVNSRGERVGELRRA